MQSKIQMKALPDNQIILASHESTVLDALLSQKVSIHHSCGGGGTCGTCRIQIIEGAENLPEPQDQELEMIQDRGFLPAERLACQIRSTCGLVFLIPAR